MRVRVIFSILIFAAAVEVCFRLGLDRPVAVASPRPSPMHLILPQSEQDALLRAEVDQASAKLARAEQKLIDDDCSFDSIPAIGSRASVKYLEVLRCTSGRAPHRVESLTSDLPEFIKAGQEVIATNAPYLDLNLLTGMVRASQHVLEQIDPKAVITDDEAAASVPMQTNDLIRDIAKKTGYWVIPGGQTTKEIEKNAMALEKFKEILRSPTLLKKISGKDVGLIYLDLPSYVQQLSIGSDSDRTYIVVNPDKSQSEIVSQLSSLPNAKERASEIRHQRIDEKNRLIRDFKLATHAELNCRVFPEMSLTACLQGLQTAQKLLGQAKALVLAHQYIDISDRSERSPSGHISLGFSNSVDEMMAVFKGGQTLQASSEF